MLSASRVRKGNFSCIQRHHALLCGVCFVHLKKKRLSQRLTLSTYSQVSWYISVWYHSPAKSGNGLRIFFHRAPRVGLIKPSNLLPGELHHALTLPPTTGGPRFLSDREHKSPALPRLPCIFCRLSAYKNALCQGVWLFFACFGTKSCSHFHDLYV